MSANSTEDLSKPSQYLSRSNKPMTFNLVALESLTSNVFLHKTDVWSSGVNIWELFPLGEDHYGYLNLHSLVKMFQAGDRLPDCKLLASQNINLFIFLSPLSLSTTVRAKSRLCDTMYHVCVILHLRQVLDTE